MPKPTKILIGIHGAPAAGVTTAATTLSRLLELTHYDLAAPIYDACASILRMHTKTFVSIPNDSIIEAFNCTKQALMADIGACLTQHGSRTLINLLELRMALAEGNEQYLNGTLVRTIATEAQADWVRSKGGTVVHIIKPEQSFAERGAQSLSIRPLDLVIRNDGTLNELHQKLHNAAKHIELGYVRIKRAS